MEKSIGSSWMNFYNENILNRISKFKRESI